jgi:subfamily B ATP-binding cassette protein MsbA
VATGKNDRDAVQSGPTPSKATSELWKLVKPLRWLLLGSFALMIVNRICGFAIPIASRYLINDVFYHREFQRLPMILGAVVFATCVQGITLFILNQQLSISGQRLVTDLRIKAQSHIGRLHISFYDNQRAGALAARIMNDVEGVKNLVGAGTIDFVSGVLASMIAIIVMVRIDPLMTAFTALILLVLGFFLKGVFGVTRPIFRERTRITAEVTGRLIESLGGVRVVKGYNAEESEAMVFAAGARRLLRNLIRSATAQSYLSLASTLAIGLAGGLIMYLGAREVKAARLDVGGYVEFNMLLVFLAAPVALLVSVGTQFSEALSGLERTAEILAEKEEDSEPRRTHEISTMRGDLRFEEVRFAYVSGAPVLHEISFHAPPGSVTALVGSSGSGKSTIISLICGFHSASSGQVLVDGVDLSSIRLSSYRKQLGVVLQESFLFDGSIRENVLFSRPFASEGQWLQACRIARVDEFAERFADGYETVVGERGVRLSGGQRQRISIARAILADPRILILDEATSSLDSESEALVQSGINFLMQGRTTFVIAHRLSTIRRADQILVIEQGRIVERGSHEALYRMKGRYFDLYMRQYEIDANLFLAPGEGDRTVSTQLLDELFVAPRA